MEPTAADLDGIRALGELMSRQACHVGAAQEYLHSTCSANGAFYGVLGFFAGTYQSALQNVTEGLAGNKRASEFAAESFGACAKAYEEADRGSHDAFSRLAGGAGWDIGPYKAAGSGATGVGGPLKAAATATEEPGKAEDHSWGGFAQDTGAAMLKDQSFLTREYTKVDGQYVRTETLGKDVEGDSTQFEQRLDNVEKGMDRVLDPGKETRKDMLDSMTHPITGDPSANGPVKDSQVSSAVQSDARAVAGLYEDYQAVMGTKDEVTKSYGDMTDAVGDVRRYDDISDDQADRSAMDWSAGR